MCGRFSLTQPTIALAETFQLDTLPAWTPRYNIAPTQTVLAIAADSAHVRQERLFRWGLVPSWAKDLAIGAKLINARAETAATKPSFRAAFKQRRCLILADGFYEWQRVDRQTKQPYYFQLADQQPFAFAGLWEHWQEEGEGEVIETCTILTTQANELLQTIHDRMPVILAQADYDRWLEPTSEPQTLLRPYNADLMHGYRVSTLVNRATNESPDCVNSL